MQLLFSAAVRGVSGRRQRIHEPHGPSRRRAVAFVVAAGQLTTRLRSLEDQPLFEIQSDPPMFTSYRIYIRTTATIAQLKGLGKSLGRWNDQHESAGCTHDVDCDGLDDLLAGELPKPEFLGVFDSFRRTVENMRREGIETVDLPNYQVEFRKLYPDTKRRHINILVEHSLECSYQPFRCGYQEAIQDLLDAEGLIEDIEAGSIPHPPLPQP